MIPLEDTAGDIIGKAQRGLGVSDSEVAKRARVSSEDLRKLRAGHFDELALWRIAPVLQLSARALVDLAQGQWETPAVRRPGGFAQFNTRYDDMSVNAYLVWDLKSREAVVFDTGGDCTEMLSRIERERLRVQAILLTHAHPDHIADLARLRRTVDATVYAPAKEPVRGAEPIEEGKTFRLGVLQIESRLTWGHSPGGMTYLIGGLESPLAIVGDSLFAGSMGGGNVSYEAAVRNNLEKILTLPDETIICPGHGPLTTVAKEKADNPFFAGRI